jgi:hypothetical protein
MVTLTVENLMSVKVARPKPSEAPLTKQMAPPPGPAGLRQCSVQ